MEGKLKEVNYARYCKRCKHRLLDETKDPCNECLSEPGRVDTHKPRYFEKIEKGTKDVRSK